MTDIDLLSIPLREIPFTLIATRPFGVIYYFEFQSEPSVPEYAAAGVAVTKAMIQGVGEPPTAWLLLPSADVNLDFFRGNEGFREPVQVVRA